MITDQRAIVVTTQDDLISIIERAVRLALKAMEPQPVSPRKKLLTPKEIHLEYGINKRILEHWRLQGVGPAYNNIGRRVYYERFVIEKFVASGSVRTTGHADS